MKQKSRRKLGFDFNRRQVELERLTDRGRNENSPTCGPDDVDPKIALMALKWSDIHPVDVFSTMLLS